MRLDRNANADKRPKYALLKMRNLAALLPANDPNGALPQPITEALKTLKDAGVLDWGDTLDTEVFVIRLKDIYAEAALTAYADAVAADKHGDPDYCNDVRQMAARSGPHNPYCKRPD